MEQKYNLIKKIQERYFNELFCISSILIGRAKIIV